MTINVRGCCAVLGWRWLINGEWNATMTLAVFRSPIPIRIGDMAATSRCGIPFVQFNVALCHFRRSQIDQLATHAKDTSSEVGGCGRDAAGKLTHAEHKYEQIIMT